MKLSVKPKILTVLVLATAVLFASCGSAKFDGLDLNLFAMDTLLSINVIADLPQDASQVLRDIVERLENKLSTTVGTSEVAGFNLSNDSFPVSDETAEIVRLSTKASVLTGGAFDITVCPLVKLWNIAHPGEDWKPPNAALISELLGRVGADKIGVSEKDGERFLTKNDPQVEIDLGGIGKGWAVGVLAEYLSGCIDENNSDGNNKSASYGTLSFGGNVAVFGAKSGGADFIVGVKNPFDPQSLIGTLSIKSGIIAVSGGYERYADYGGSRYHHILDPSTGKPSDSDLASAAVWVDAITPEAGALSDALSTAFFVIGSEKALELLESGVFGNEFGYEFGAVLIKTNGVIITTENLTGRFIKQ